MSLNKKSANAAPDDTLLALAIGCMAFADGTNDPSDVAIIKTFAATLPEFANGSFTQPWIQSTKILKKHKGSINACINELKNLSTPNLKKKAFIFAVDIAFSTGDINKNEEKVLDKMKAALGIDELFAERAVTVMATKYSM